MRKYVFPILFFVVLGLPFALRWVAGKQTKLAGGGAEAELVVITANQEGIRREFADAFSEWHREKYGKPAVVHYLHYGAAEIVKYFDAAGSQLKVDAVWGGGDYLFDQQLKKQWLR